LRADLGALATVVDAAFRTTPHEAKACLFRVLRPEGRADRLDSFHKSITANGQKLDRDDDGSFSS
jgi:hypothetical protein